MSVAWIERDDDIPLVRFRWILPGGASREARSEEGLTNFALEAARRGSPGRDRLATARWIGEVATHLNIQVQAEQSQVSANVPASRLDEFLVRLPRLFQEADPAPADLESLRRELIEGFELTLENPQSRVGLLWKRSLFGDDSAGHFTAGSPASLASLTAGDLARCRESLCDAPSWLAAGGDVDLDEETLASRVGAPGEPVLSAPAPWPHGGGARLGLWHDPDLSQATILLGWCAPVWSGRDIVVNRLLEKILCSEFTSHLCQDFRQRAGLTYGIGGSHQLTRRGSIFRLRTSTSTQRAPRFVSDLLGALNVFGQGAGTYSVATQEGGEIRRDVVFDSAVLDGVRRKALNSLPFRFHTPQARISRRMEHELFGALPPDPEIYREALESVMPDELALRARHIFAERVPVVAIVDNMKVNGPAYRDLMDWNAILEGESIVCGLNSQKD